MNGEIDLFIDIKTPFSELFRGGRFLFPEEAGMAQDNLLDTSSLAKHY